jgi:hypothetical protein
MVQPPVKTAIESGEELHESLRSGICVHHSLSSTVHNISSTPIESQREARSAPGGRVEGNDPVRRTVHQQEGGAARRQAIGFA